ncbi:MAG: TIGR03000 domain-containing protein [Gemmataceae bacterium]
MYSVVLATMLTTSGAAPAWGGMACHGGCHGGFGFQGGLACHGGFGFGCHGAFSCHGCHGAYGSAYHVIPVRTAPIGGISFGSCQGCFGSCFGCYGAYYPYYGSAVWGANYTNYAPPVQEVTEIPVREKKKTEAGPAGMKDAVARITVELPEDAKLTVDGVACPLTSTTRTLETPELQPGQKYTYTLEAQINRNGETISASRRVVFESGKLLNVDFRKLGSTQSVQR